MNAIAPLTLGAQATKGYSVMGAHQKYRPDIDGLRACAIVPVVLFHAFPHSVRGGYVGVDIFFVISGFLISTIILQNLADSRFSFVEFYSRRIRRIFPALIAVLLFVLVFGWFALLAPEYETLARHIVGGATFTSNLLLWREVDYFDVGAESKPLLHLWSLAVEEQFYIFWPLILWFSWKTGKNLYVIISVIALASFAVNIYYWGRDSGADFYSPISRFWEPLVGAFLGYVNLRNPLLRNMFCRVGGWLSVIGAIFIVTALMVATEHSPFPGVLALLPVMGAVLLIAAGSGAFINRHLLASKAFVWLGLISYPLYLWHWPLLSFLRILGSEYPSRGSRIVVVLVGVGLAWGTYRLIEVPSRRFAKSQTYTLVLVAMVLSLGLIASIVDLKGGLPERPEGAPNIINQGYIGHDEFHHLISSEFFPCLPEALRSEAGIRCAQSKDGPVDIAIIGDSHAENVFPGLAEKIAQLNVAFYMHDALPVLGNPVFSSIFRNVIASPSVKVVFLSAYWNIRLKEVPAERRVSSLEETVAALVAAGKQVVLVEDTPNFSFTPRFCKYAAGFLREHRCTEDAETNISEHRITAQIFARIADDAPTLKLVDAFDDFCTSSRCSMADRGNLLFRDPNHLTIEGSRFFAQHLLERYPQIVGE